MNSELAGSLLISLLAVQCTDIAFEMIFTMRLDNGRVEFDLNVRSLFQLID